MPCVSIITCTYNRAGLIGETIYSVLAQTYTDFEYLIIDEGQDGTDAVVRDFSDERIRYFNVPNTGGHQSKLRNFGIRQSQGRYVAFVDSDDIWLPHKLRLQVEGLQRRPDLAFSFTDVSLFNRAGTIKDSLYKKTGVFAGSVFSDFARSRFVICTTTLVFDRRCIETIGYLDEQFKLADFDFIMSLTAHFEAFVVNEPLVRVRKHDSNVSGFLPLDKAEGFLISYERMIAQGFIKRHELKATLGRLCYSLGIEFLRQGDHAYAAAFFSRSIARNPFFWKSYVRFLMTKIKFIKIAL